MFICKDWKGEPKETKEIKPKWFEKDKIPFEKMWNDAKYWAPLVLKGDRFQGEFLYSKDLKVLDFYIILR